MRRKRTTDRAANALRQLRQNVALLERLCDMVDSAGPAGADAELRQQVAVQRGVVEDLTRATRRHLTELLRDAENSPPATAPRRRAAHARLRTDFERVEDRIRQATRRLGRVAAAPPVPPARPPPAGTAAGRDRSPPRPPPGDVDLLVGEQRVQLQVAMQDEDIDEALVREREAELRNINADVHKVNEIFRDLATLVDKQQDDVDKIGDLVERSHAHAEKGLDQV